MSREIIRLHAPRPSPEGQERLHLFAGRHLGEEEFDYAEHYRARRLARLLADDRPGIVSGLTVDERFAQPTGAPPHSTGFRLRPGLAVDGARRPLTLSLPLDVAWSELFRGASPGVYFITLQRRDVNVDHAPPSRACRREEFDPRRDLRTEAVTSVRLSPPLPGWDPQQGIPTADQANRLTAQFLDLDLLFHCDGTAPLDLAPFVRCEEVVPPDLAPFVHCEGAVPVAMVATDGTELLWLDPTAGRFPAAPAAVQHALAFQAEGRMRRLLRRGTTALDALSLGFTHLPAAGRLPEGAVVDPAGGQPLCRFFPPHFDLHMVPLPESLVAGMVERARHRPPLDLTRPEAERVRILLAVADRDYRPDLLTPPKGDPRLLKTLVETQVKADRTWYEWRLHHDRLFHMDEGAHRRLHLLERAARDDALDRAELRGLLSGDLTKLPGIAPPAPLATPFAWAPERGVLLPASALEPRSAEAVREWLEGHPELGFDPLAESNWSTSAAHYRYDGDTGLAAQLAVEKAKTPLFERAIQAHRSAREAKLDLLKLQRQYLDTFVSAVADLVDGETPEEGAPIERTYTPKTVADPPPARLNPAIVHPPLFRATAFEAGGFGEKARPAKRTGKSAAAAAISPTALESLGAVQPRVLSGIYRFFNQVKPVSAHLSTATAAMLELRNRMRALGDVTGVPDKAEDPYGKPDGFKDYAWNQLKKKKGKEPSDYEILNLISRELIDDIQRLEGSARADERGYIVLHHLFEAHRARLTALSEAIDEGLAHLDVLDNAREEAVGDYAVADRLLEEEWRRVKQRAEERERVLHRPRGIYYLRMRPVDLSLPLPDPLPLRRREVDDLVPGCGLDEARELPESLDDFLDTLLELPMASFAPLQPLRHKLPGRQRLKRLHERRRARDTHDAAANAPWAPAGRGGLGRRLERLLTQNRAALFRPRRSVVSSEGALSDLQRESAATLSLEDLLAATAGAPRHAATRLRDRLELAGACMLDHLAALPAPLRFRWAQAAEDDLLPVERPERWPALEEAEERAFNALRTLIELVHWLFRQLAADAGGEARTAMRNYVRAALLLSAHGDPTGIAHGKVSVPPGRLRDGEQLRIELNREVAVGTRLDLLDARQRVIGTLRVDDFDERGAVARVVRVLADTQEFTGWTASGRIGGRR